jgi:hypothetical protein
VARFFEVFRCVGVDEAADPPAVLLGYNRAVLVALADGDGFTVKSRHANVEVVEVTDPTQLIARLNDRHKALMQPGVDPKLRETLLPSVVKSVRGPTRYFSVYGKGLVGPHQPSSTQNPGSQPKTTPSFRLWSSRKKRSSSLSGI